MPEPPKPSRKFPFVKPRFLPRAGRKFELKHLQPLPRALYERVSDLTRIPLRELLPRRQVLPGPNATTPDYFHNLLGGAAYEPYIHSITYAGYLNPLSLLANLFDRVAAGIKTSFTQHETMHSLHFLLTPLIDRHRRKGFTYFLEVVANAGQYRIANPYPAFQHGVNDFYRKYGVDGLLAVMVAKPAPLKSAHVRNLERKLLEKGILSSKGFTLAGVRWFRKTLPTEKLLERLDSIRKNRESSGLPVD